MAMAWIVQIIHSSPEVGNVTLRQNDTGKHPVIRGEQFNDRDIVITPGTRLEIRGDDRPISWFVVPWAGEGRLRTNVKGKIVDYEVGPVETAGGDCLRANDGNSGKLIGYAEIGPRGGEKVWRTELTLLVTNSQIEFQVFWSGGSGKFDGQAVLDNLFKLGEVVAGFIP